MSTLLAYLFLAIAVSFLCSTLESVLMTTTHSYINLREEEGYAPATRMKRYKSDPERPLAAILSLNTIANTVGAAGVGRQATLLFGDVWFGVVSAIVTILILLFGEIVPKTIGTTYWKSLMGFTANTIHLLIYALYPIVWVIEQFSRVMPEGDEEATVSREEVIAMASVGEEEGVIEEDENKIIRNVMRLETVKASDIMTPRVVANIAPEAMTLREFYDTDEYDHNSRIPVYQDEEEYITGYVLRDDALEDLAEDHFDKRLGDIKRPLPAYNEEDNIGDIFDRMLRDKSQIAQIIDEYGCFVGIITLEDIVETIFGLEIVDESDVITDMQQYARERWKQRQRRFNKRTKSTDKAEKGDKADKTNKTDKSDKNPES